MLRKLKKETTRVAKQVEKEAERLEEKLDKASVTADLSGAREEATQAVQAAGRAVDSLRQHVTTETAKIQSTTHALEAIRKELTISNPSAIAKADEHLKIAQGLVQTLQTTLQSIQAKASEVERQRGEVSHVSNRTELEHSKAVELGKQASQVAVKGNAEIQSDLCSPTGIVLTTLNRISDALEEVNIIIETHTREETLRKKPEQKVAIDPVLSTQVTRLLVSSHLDQAEKLKRLQGELKEKEDEVRRLQDALARSKTGEGTPILHGRSQHLPVSPPEHDTATTSRDLDPTLTPSGSDGRTGLK